MSTDSNFWRERRAEAVSNRGPSAYQPNALPLGQTVLKPPQASCSLASLPQPPQYPHTSLRTPTPISNPIPNPSESETSMTTSVLKQDPNT